jgi:hypothetical protein
MQAPSDPARVVADPGRHDHFVQLYQDPGYLVDAVAEYVGNGLARGEGAIVIARPAHRAALLAILARQACQPGQLVLLDADETLARFMVNGMPAWSSFREVIGGAIAELRLAYPTVRAYGEMVDVLWQGGSRDAAIRLEEYWNELGKLQTFSLFCAYRLDPLDSALYGGPLESVCKVHSHLVPSREWRGLEAAVQRASEKVLEQPLADVLIALARNHRPPTEMSDGHAALFWLRQNMPRTAEKVLSELRARAAPAG